MMFPSSYPEFKISSINDGNYSLVPIRYQDREEIRKWRNDQINLLRQKEILTKHAQDKYFLNTVAENFKTRFPKQLLFSFLDQDELIGYGGLVHIDWKSKNAELSFLLKTEKSDVIQYLVLFKIFISLIQRVAKLIKLHKIYTFGYDVATYRFQPLLASGFYKEAELIDHIKIDRELLNIKIFSKILT